MPGARQQLSADALSIAAQGREVKLPADQWHVRHSPPAQSKTHPLEQPQGSIQRGKEVLTCAEAHEARAGMMHTHSDAVARDGIRLPAVHSAQTHRDDAEHEYGSSSSLLQEHQFSPQRFQSTKQMRLHRPFRAVQDSAYLTGRKSIEMAEYDNGPLHRW